MKIRKSKYFLQVEAAKEVFHLGKCTTCFVCGTASDFTEFGTSSINGVALS